jgi:hypothetical protein
MFRLQWRQHDLSTTRWLRHRRRYHRFELGIQAAE